MRVPVAFLLAALPVFAAAQSPYQATGIKICEPGSGGAIIWTRLTKNAERMDADRPMPLIQYRDPETGVLEERGQGKRPDRVPVVTFPDGATIDTLQGACPGAPGQVQIWHKSLLDTRWRKTLWMAVDPEQDFTRQVPLRGLAPATRFQVQVHCRAAADAPEGTMVKGGFKTAPAPDEAARVSFTVSTGQAYPDQDAPGGGYRIYGAMQALMPDFFVHTGDILYYDRDAKSLALARLNWARMYSLPTNVMFHRNVGSYFIKDDHDTWKNDCWPTLETRFMGDFTFEQGVKVFLEQVGMGRRTYRTVRWGKDLQIWMVEGRDFRSANTMPDGPGKTIWGAEQIAWFKRTVAASDATFRVLFSPTPLVGPDRENKNDNHANAGFTHEGDMLRAFIAAQKNMVVVCGDRHWQYISRHPGTGVMEFSCGPASDEHAGGWSQENYVSEYHQYLNVTGGFLEGTVGREGAKPVLTFRHYSVDGEVLNEHRIEAE